MKRFVLGCLVFVVTVMLSANIFAQNYDITEYCGDNGLLDRTTTFNKGDHLNIKNDIQQNSSTINDILETGISIEGNNHKLDGNGYAGFKMAKYDCGSLEVVSTMTRTTLTNYYKTDNDEYVIGVYGSWATLVLEDVNIIDNMQNSTFAAVNIFDQAELRIKATKDIYIDNYYSNRNTANISSYDFELKDGGILTFLPSAGATIYVMDKGFIGKDGIITVGDYYSQENGTLALGGDCKDFTGNINIYNATVKELEHGRWFYTSDDSTTTLINATLDFSGNQYMEEIRLGTLNLRGQNKARIDVDLSTSNCWNVDLDYFRPSYCTVESTATLTIDKINILCDSEEILSKGNLTYNENLAEAIRLPKDIMQVNGPIYLYDVAYSSSNRYVVFSTETYAGDLVFRRTSSYNPKILVGKIAVAGTQISQEEIFDTVFNNAGNYTFFQKQGTSAGDVEDRDGLTLWGKVLGSQEDVELEDYTKLKTTYYGLVAGLDTDRQYTENFDATYGLIASYIGGELKDDDNGNKVNQQGGYIGARANLYFGKLFVNGIIDFGMISNTADTDSDSNDFGSKVIGFAARVGYNFGVSKNNFTIQPNLALTGKYILTDDFETFVSDDISVKEKVGDIKNLTIEPGVKLAKNLGKCWILTGEGKYVIENTDGDITVEYDKNYLLPEMSYKNYANLGLGIEKIWGYTVAHLKLNKTIGGRDGIVVNAGVEFKF